MTTYLDGIPWQRLSDSELDRNAILLGADVGASRRETLANMIEVSEWLGDDAYIAGVVRGIRDGSIDIEAKRGL